MQFGRGHYEEHFCEIILNLGQWLRRRFCFKDISIFSSQLPFCWTEMILVEGVRGNIHVKLF